MSAAANTEPCGVLAVNKPAGCTSHDVVGMMRKLYGTRRVGHTGTLDPMAEGVLVILVGRAAKAAEYLSHDEKRYRATLRLGLTTDTEDTTGKTLTETDTLPSPEAVTEVCRSFVGKIRQVPPMYSALKVDGRKLVDLAREGKVIERQAREIEIFALGVTPTDVPSDYVLDVHCSGGTYIRTLCADIGRALGCGGVMASLLRTEACGFPLDACVTPAELGGMTMEERLVRLAPVESLFWDLPVVRLPAFYEKLSRSGCEIYQKKIGSAFPTGQRIRMADAGGHFYALGEVRDYPDGSAIKAIKMFEI